MTNHQGEGWLLPFLATIRARPGMYLGDERVGTLRSFLAGYEQARADLGFVGMADSDVAILSRFDAWLEEKTRAHGSAGSARWPQLLHRIDASERNVQTFLKLFEEFLQSEGRSLDRVEKWVPRGWEPDPASIKRGF